MQAYDLGFGHTSTELFDRPVGDPNYDSPGEAVALPDPMRAGWHGGMPPAIGTDRWPRSTVGGSPMLHILTLELPPEYQRRGEEFPAISFFSGEGQFAEGDEAIEEILAGREATAEELASPYLAGVAAHAVAADERIQILTDEIDGKFALVWITAEELSGRATPPADHRDDEQREVDDEGFNAWDNELTETPVWLAVRPDPNAGVVPTEAEGTDYQRSYGADFSLLPWAAELHGRSHLGGTTFCVQSQPELTPYYLELEELAGLNFGGDGNAQIDLENGEFDWACG